MSRNRSGMEIKMSTSIVLEQMAMIALMILTGMFLYKKNMLSESTCGQLSGLIVNVTSPALLICSAFDDSPKLSYGELAVGMIVFVIVYAALIAFSYIIPLLLRIPSGARYSYQMLTLFGNVGFIGIPLAAAVIGPDSLIFVSMSNLVYNVLIYTFGMSILKTAARSQHPEDCAQTSLAENKYSDSIWSKLINVGTVSALLTIILYVCNFNVPVIISSTLSYAGRTTTFLSMLVLGVSVARMNLKDIFSVPKLYAFTIIRQMLVPVCITLAIGLFIKAPLLLSTCALTLSVPAGNMPLMLSKQLNVDETTISKGIILTTVFSLATIPIVAVFTQ